MGTFARWCLRHRKLVVLGWLVTFIGLGLLAATVGADYARDFRLPSTESTRAFDLLEKSFPDQSGETDRVVFHVDEGSVTDPAVEQRMTSVLDRIAQVDGVASVTSPYAEAGAGQISRDGATAFANVLFVGFGQRIDEDSVDKVVDIAQSARQEGLDVEIGGEAVALTEQEGFGTSELIGLAAAAVILFIAFGSLLAMALPIAVAIIAIGSALSFVVLLTHVFSIADFAPQLSLLLGLGVGIDYALFIVTRYRQNVQAGMETDEAIVTSVNTSGRAVLFAGITVCISVLGMFVLGVSFLYGLAVCAALAVATTMVAALTLLPALLGFSGHHVLSRREQRRLKAEGAHAPELSGAWGAWARRVSKHKVIALTGSLVLMFVLSLPFFAMRLGVSDEGNGTADRTTRQAYDLLADGFGPGFNGPFTIVIDTSTPGSDAAIDRVEAALREQPRIAAVAPAITNEDGTTAVITVYPTTAPQDEATSDLLHKLRDDVVPEAVAGTGAVEYVGGLTAVFDDFATVLAHKLPQFVAVVILLSFLLLMTVFRSIVVPIKAALLNLLSITASFGVIVAVFQWGWGMEAIGLDRTGPIEPFLPVMIFAILFGLSMDYEVFLVSRMHEEWVRTRDNSQAVIRGLAATGRVITAAAAIMVVLFASFAFGGERVLKMFGISFATAVFLDAFVIRTVMVPAFMQVMGERNWWLPAWLDKRLPDVHLEAEDLLDHPELEPVFTD